MSASSNRKREGWPLDRTALLLPVLAFLLVLPLLLHGPSCGHDFTFHIQSWMDAGAQIRHGVLLPQWAYSPAFNAGEPRFVFYPPLSWLLGSGLMLALPAGLAPAAFTWLALTLAGGGMYVLARRFAPPQGALLAASVYVANPYVLFTAFERTAFAELLAAAWMPWLLRAALDEQPGVLAIALPLALLWLTNAPAAVMGTYTLVLVVLVRLVRRAISARKEGALSAGWLCSQAPLVGHVAGGLSLGFGLASFYLLPAAWERRYVQIAMAIIPNMRVEDNFLFGHTGNGPHDQVLHTASLVAISMLALTMLILAIGRLRLGSAEESEQGAENTAVRERWVVLTTLTVLIGLLMLHLSLPLWHLLPELAFLQFSWRWVAVLGCVLGCAVALLAGRWKAPALLSFGLALVIAVVASPLALRPFRQACEAHELPQERAALFSAHHGVEPTDEYTPTDADNDQLRWHDPAWWLAADPNTPAPNTVPNPGAQDPDYDQPAPVDQTISGFAPMHLHLDLQQPEDLILNLRAYPAWVVRVNGQQPRWEQRDDGLVALALPAGSSSVDVHWRRLPDVYAGDALSGCALCAALWLGWRSRSRRIEP